jgi:hypothetical protein
MAKAPFKLRSGNTTAFKMMGSSPNKERFTEMFEGVADAEYGGGITESIDLASKRAQELIDEEEVEIEEIEEEENEEA